MKSSLLFAIPALLLCVLLSAKLFRTAPYFFLKVQVAPKEQIEQNATNAFRDGISRANLLHIKPVSFGCIDPAHCFAETVQDNSIRFSNSRARGSLLSDKSIAPPVSQKFFQCDLDVRNSAATSGFCFA
jgi:hypothetical protein